MFNKWKEYFIRAKETVLCQAKDFVVLKFALFFPDVKEGILL